MREPRSGSRCQTGNNAALLAQQLPNRRQIAPADLEPVLAAGDARLGAAIGQVAQAEQAFARHQAVAVQAQQAVGVRFVQ